MIQMLFYVGKTYAVWVHTEDCFLQQLAKCIQKMKNLKTTLMQSIFANAKYSAKYEC